MRRLRNALLVLAALIVIGAIGYALPDDLSDRGTDTVLAAFLAIGGFLICALILARTRVWTVLGIGLLFFFAGGSVLYAKVFDSHKGWGLLRDIDWLWVARAELAVGILLTLIGIAFREWEEWH